MTGMDYEIRKAVAEDLDEIAKIYEEVHDAEEAGITTTGWIRGIYPIRPVAEEALARGDLYVMTHDGKVIGTAVINQIQVDVYEGAAWRYPAEDGDVLVLHTLVISPSVARKGYGRAFVEYYEDQARQRGISYLRIDTNVRNTGARKLYAGMGFEERDVKQCRFNGLEGIQLLLLEKKLSA